MIANNDNISNILGISYNVKASDVEQATPVFTDGTGSDKAERDYEYARRNLYDIIEQGQGALTDMIDFARQAQHPRAFEVVGTLINNLVDANQKLLHLSKQVKDIKKQEKEKEGPDTINNTLYVGSTADILKLLKSE